MTNEKLKSGDLKKSAEDALIKRMKTLIRYIDEQPFYRRDDRLSNRAEKQLYSIINQIRDMEKGDD